ncbi:uracil-DNA glycosylase [Vulgatibacter sp.]|uniref:uracil-DNA glycosylase n=1 Tax=Vulgatibacter sp. TaxID=1971226 RepID=UPI0035650F6D
MSKAFESLQKELVACGRCDRLVAWREQVGAEKRAAFRHETYWARPVPSFGDPAARLLVLGLAPAAHGANRTGRVFTGDGDPQWLFRALHRAGFASQPFSRDPRDGLRLHDCVVTNAVHCVPPGNRPSATELAICGRSFLDRELAALPHLQVVVALGRLAFDAYLAAAARLGHQPKPRPRFGHLAAVEEGLPHVLLASYHPSRQNTNTGLLTEPMFDRVFTEVRRRLA